MTLPRSPRAAGSRAVDRQAGDGLDGLDDRALVARVTEGDGAALEALYGRYGRACFGLARRILADEQFAQDVVQEVFLTVWRDASRFDASRGGFSTWLLSMTHHKAVDAVRREENLRKRRTTAETLEGREYDGILGFFAYLDSKKYKAHYRIHAARFRLYALCGVCGGGRLNDKALAPRLGGKNLAQVSDLSIDQVTLWLADVATFARERSATPKIEGETAFAMMGVATTLWTRSLPWAKRTWSAW